MNFPVEIDAVEYVSSVVHAKMEWAGPAMYAVQTGRWRMETASDKEAGSTATWDLKPGACVAITRAQPHQLVVMSEESHPDELAVCLRISFREHRNSLGFLSQFSPVVQRESWAITPEINGAFPGRPQERAFSSGNDLRNEVAGIAGMLVSLLLASELPPLRSGETSHLEPEITQAWKLMQQNPENPWTIALLAESVGISRSSFARKFKEQTGQTPNEALSQIRMELASGYLRDRRRTLKEIAKLTGYQSVSAFSTAYKRWAGTPPRAQR